MSSRSSIKENSDSESCVDGKARGTKAGKKKPQQEVVRILKALRKKRNLTLFEIIAHATLSELTNDKNERQCKKTFGAAKNRLSPKQYYTSLSLLMRAGLIIKRKGNSVYVLSILGTRVYSALNLIKKGKSNFWPTEGIRFNG